MKLIEKNNKKGITLIALVITIIVLLILAGVSIAMLTGDNSLLGNAKKTGPANKIGAAKDEVGLAYNTAMQEYYEEKYASTNGASGTFATKLETAINEITSNGKNHGCEIVYDKTVGTITITNEGYKVIGTVDTDGSAGISWGEMNKANGIETSGTWTYDANNLTCTCGTTTVKIGDYVNYSPTEGTTEKTYLSPKDKNGYGDQTFSSNYGGTWQVLGVDEEGCLMLISSDIIKTTSNGYFYLKGQNGYVNGVKELKNISAIYGKGKYAKSARSVNVDDVNKITGYVDNVYNAGTSNVDQTGNQVTYTLNSDGYIHYNGTKYPKTDTTSTNTSFTYWTGSEWKKLASGESATLTHNYYRYYPQTLSTTESSETKIKNKENSKNAYDLLFTNVSSTYWLGSQYVCTSDGDAVFGVRVVYWGYVDTRALYFSERDYWQFQ